MVVQTDKYKNTDIAGNPCLSRCEVCGGDIFYLEIFKEARVWWHESLELDWSHSATPAVSSERV